MMLAADVADLSRFQKL